MWLLILEYGMPTVSWYAELPLRRRVSMSAIGSVIDMAGVGLPRHGFRPVPRTDLWRLLASNYQLDLVMPGSSPRCAIVRKQIRHRPNLRYTARGRPQREHRV